MKNKIVSGILLLFTILLLQGCWRTIDKIMTADAWNHIDLETLESPQESYGLSPYPPQDRIDLYCSSCYRAGRGQASHWDDNISAWSRYDRIPVIGTILRQQTNNDGSRIAKKIVKVIDTVEFKYIPDDDTTGHKFFKKFPILKVYTCAKERDDLPCCYDQGNRFSADSIAETTDLLFGHQAETHLNHTVMESW